MITTASNINKLFSPRKRRCFHSACEYHTDDYVFSAQAEVFLISTQQ